jgi:hypothetical protein
MGRQDVRDAMKAMDADESVRSRLAAGDFGAVDGLDLSADERLLVQDAASDMPEVAGFASDIFAKIGDIKGESLDDKHRGQIEIASFLQSPMKWQNAVKYGWDL